MGHSMKENITQEKCMGMAYTSGLITLSTKATGKTIILTVKVSICGMMVENTMENGKTT